MFKRSSSIKELNLDGNGLSVAGVRSMVPFLQNANSLIRLDLDKNNIQSEGFNALFRALSDSPIAQLYCSICGIESIEIDSERMPKYLKNLTLSRNEINANGCREIAKLLQGADVILESLLLNRNKIDDDGVEILVGALQNNKSLKTLELGGNCLSKQGEVMLLKLVNDISRLKQRFNQIILCRIFLV